MKTLTTKGYQVFALRPFFDAKTGEPRWVGKIRMVEGNPYYDEYFDWHREDWRNGVAIGHEMGDLNMDAAKNG